MPERLAIRWLGEANKIGDKRSKFRAAQHLPGKRALRWTDTARNPVRKVASQAQQKQEETAWHDP